MLRKTVYAAIVLLLAGGSAAGIIWFRGASAQAAENGACPPGYTSYAVLEPVQDATQSSKIIDQGCKPIETAQEVFLNPIQPGDEGWEIEPYKPTEQSEIVQGPSVETVYRCVIFLEPIQPGEESSKASEPVCSAGEIDTLTVTRSIQAT